MKVKQLISIVLLLTGVFSAQAAVTASQILAGVRGALFNQPSVEIFFTLTSDGASSQGSATMQDAAFTFVIPSFQAWYDGKTLWAMQRTVEEINISEPTADEVMAMNPFGILTDPESWYEVKKLPDSAGTYSVRLTPKAKGTGIADIIVSCAASDYSPRSIVIKFDDRRTVTMTVDRVTHGKRLPATTFKYDSKLYPAREIIDLR